MEGTTINSTDLRIRTRDIIERARFKGERFVVHTFGKPVVVILGIEEYATLLKTAARADAKSAADLIAVAQQESQSW